MFLIKKLNILQKTFYEDSCRAQLFELYPISLNDASILSLKRSYARCNVALFMPTNAASIAILNDVTLRYQDLFVTLSITLVIVQEI